jgi:hypothetical protein
MTAKTRAIPSLHRDRFLAKVNSTCSVASSGNTTSPYCRAVISHKTYQTMKNVIFLLIALIISSCASRQTSDKNLLTVAQNLKMDTTYFLLGTLSEYNGRFWQISKPNQVDRYNVYEKPLIDFQHNLISNKFNIELITLIDTSSTTSEYETFSKELSLTLNSFFTKDGIFIDSCLKTSDQINSYLLGRYYRYGRQANDSIFLIHLFNFPNHFICNNLLRQSARKVYLKQINEMPAQFIYFFIPNQELKGFFNIISDQKIKLADSYDTFMKNLWGVTEDEYIKTMNNIHNKELLEIISKF